MIYCSIYFEYVCLCTFKENELLNYNVEERKILWLS